MTMLVLTLISGRTLKQAHAMHIGKDSDAYRKATTVVSMHPGDLARLALAEGQRVALTSPHGRVEVVAEPSDIPEGLVFLPMGPTANALIGPDTEGTGMPAFKGIPVEAAGA